MSVRLAGHFEFAMTDVGITGTERALTLIGSYERIIFAVNSPKLAGIGGGTEGRTLFLVNASGVDLTMVQHNDTSNAAPVANRIVTHNTTLFNGTGCLLWYDGRRNLWLVVGRG